MSNVPGTRTLYENSRLSSSATRVLPQPLGTCSAGATGSRCFLVTKRPHPLRLNVHAGPRVPLIVSMIMRGFESGCCLYNNRRHELVPW